MPDLPPRPDLGQLRRSATNLLRAARSGEADALARLAGSSAAGEPALANAQLAVAREFGFASWPKLKAEAEAEVERRDALNSGDARRLRALLAEQPELARARCTPRCSG